MLRKIQKFWGPKMRGTVGSLYDIVADEEERLRKLAEGRKDIPETPGLGNKIYQQHTMVVGTVEEFKLVSNDFIFMMKESQSRIYTSMSTWVGRPQDPDIAAQITHLKGLSFSDTLNNLRLVLVHLEQENLEETRKLILNQFAPVYEGLSKLLRKMDRVSAKMQQHLTEITPIMIQYSQKNLPELTNEIELTRTRSVKGILAYDPQFQSIISEKSTSVIALTPSTAASAELFRPPFLSRAFYTMVRMLTCSRKNATRVIRPPILVENNPNDTNDEDRDLVNLDFRNQYLDQDVEQDQESFTVITEHQEFASQTDSFCQMNKEVKEALRKRGISIPRLKVACFAGHTAEPILDESGSTRRNSKAVEPTRRVYGITPKAVQELTKEDILLENTHEVAILHAGLGVINSESSVSDFSEKDKAEVFPSLSAHSYTFPEDPRSYLLNRVTQVKNIILTISEMVREMEGNLYALPYDKLNVDPRQCLELADLLRLIKEKAKLLDIIADFKIYMEEEIKLTTGVRNVYLETLKCTELFQGFGRMVKVDQDLLFQILRDFHAEEVVELRPILAAHNETLHELKRCPPLEEDFPGVKLSTCEW